jgi:VanZ family protein
MVAAILISLPMTPVFWMKATSAFGPRFNALGYFAVFAFVPIFVVYLVRHRGKRSISKAVLLAALTVVYYVLLKYRCRFPAERLHLFEYGLLACLSYGAFRFDFSGMKAYALSFIFSSLFGFLDEGIQCILPNRVCELRDAATNVIASALGLIVMALLLQDTRRPTSSSETTI